MIYTLDGIAPEFPQDGDYWVADDANVIGRVRLESAVSIWFGATLRGDNEWITIGPGSNVQEGCVLHTDMGFPLTVGRDCTVGHKAILHGCEIGDETLIGMGAVVLNGAKIGRNCLIGAGTLIPEGKIIPDGSMVLGAPGKIIRELDTQKRGLLRVSALSYQENMRRFKASLKPMMPE